MDINWPKYNQQLIKRGEFLVNPKFLDNWNSEVKKMNVGKIGQPYFYPDSMIEFIVFFHCKGYDYRGCEGILRGLSKNYKHKFPVISYTQICRRINKLDINFETVEENLVVAIDGSGEKVSRRGEWIRHKWKVRKGWIKVVIMASKNGTIDIRLGNENLDERKAARGMIRKNNKRIKKVLMDGLHDCRDTFNLCEEYGIETAIKIRKNANVRALGSPRRRQEVIIYKSMPHEEWVREKGYGMRWPLSEGYFSACKGIFRETVNATKKRNMYKEVRLKFWCYNKLLEIT